MFGDDDRLKTALAVPWDLNGRFPELGLEPLGGRAIPGIGILTLLILGVTGFSQKIRRDMERASL